MAVAERLSVRLLYHRQQQNKKDDAPVPLFGWVLWSDSRALIDARYDRTWDVVAMQLSERRAANYS